MPAWWAWELAEPSFFSCMLHTAFQGVVPEVGLTQQGHKCQSSERAPCAREQHDAS